VFSHVRERSNTSASNQCGGTSFCPFHTMLAAYYVGREGQTKPGISLGPQHLWYRSSS